MAVDWLLTEEERKQPILGRNVCLDREVASDTTRNVMQICNVNSAHGVNESDISECQGHVTFQVPGAQDILSTRGMTFSDHKTTTSMIGSRQV